MMYNKSKQNKLPVQAYQAFSSYEHVMTHERNVNIDKLNLSREKTE